MSLTLAVANFLLKKPYDSKKLRVIRFIENIEKKEENLEPNSVKQKTKKILSLNLKYSQKLNGNIFNCSIKI